MTWLRRWARELGSLVLALLLVAAAMAGAPLSWDQLRFTESADTGHLKALLKAIPQKTSGWSHYPLRSGGNFLTERWMKGDGEVLNESYMTSAGNAWYQLEALHYNLPQAFGCLLSAGRQPARDGIGVRFWYCSGGKSIVGEGADLDFAVWKQGKMVAEVPILRIPVSLPEPFELEGSASSDDWRASLALLPDFASFQASTADRYQRTLTGFASALKEGRVQKRIYEEYRGGGIPPESHLVSITPAEAEELGRHVERQVAGWREMLKTHGSEMHRALLEVVPLSALLN